MRKASVGASDTREGPAPSAAAPRPDVRRAAWPTFGFDAARSGWNPDATETITPTTVGTLRKLWTTTLPAAADSSPILLRDVATPHGTADVLYLTTLDGALVALDAATGAQLWIAGTRGPSKLTNASPVADPSRRWVYSYGLDGQVHRYRADNGAEVLGGGWPALVTRMPRTEKGSSALNAANGRVYVTTSGYLGDAPPYQGHVVSIDLGTGQPTVFNSLCATTPGLLGTGDCASQRSGIWARAGVVVDPLTGNLFLATGNGPFDADRGGHDWGDSVLELSPDGARLLDSYTPANFAQLDESDQDLGSTAPALLPALPASRVHHLAVQGGKDGVLRLLNRDDLSGRGGPGHVAGELQAVATPGGCEMLTQPAVWSDPAEGGGGAIWLFASDACASAGYRVRVASEDGSPRLEKVWATALPTTSPVVAGGVVFAAAKDGELLALEPRTGRQLWSSRAPPAGSGIGPIHWESPIVVGGRVFCSDQSRQVTAYGLGARQ